MSDTVTKELTAARTRANRAEAALREIAAGSPPDDWESRDMYGDYIGHGDHGDDDFVDDVDPSNSGDVHAHGWAEGRWSAAKIARDTLKGI